MFLMLSETHATRDGSAMRVSKVMKEVPGVRKTDRSPSARGFSADLTYSPLADDTDPMELPFERGLMKGDVLSSQKLSALLMEETLPLRIGDYEAQSLTDLDASELTSLYRQVVERALTSTGTRVRVIGFACGIRVCQGVLAEGEEQDYWDWRDAFSGNPELSGSGLLSVIIALERDPPTLRFGFAVDPSLIPEDGDGG